MINYQKINTAHACMATLSLFICLTDSTKESHDETVNFVTCGDVSAPTTTAAPVSEQVFHLKSNIFALNAKQMKSTNLDPVL